jgi:hypothetical protein
MSGNLEQASVGAGTIYIHNTNVGSANGRPFNTTDDFTVNYGPITLAVERTIGLIYETIANPLAWREVIHDIGNQLGASAAWMFQPGPAGPTYFALKGISDSVIRSYIEYYHTVDILVTEGARREAELAGRAVRECDIVDENIWRQSEGYNDLCVPNGIGQILTAPLTRIDQQHLPPVLSFFRPPNAEPFSDQSVHTLQNLLPHIQRAVRLRSTVASEPAAVPTWTASLLEQVPFGVFLLDGAGCVLHVNAVARSAVDQKDGLLIRSGKLTAATGTGARRLEALIGSCLTSPDYAR